MMKTILPQSALIMTLFSLSPLVVAGNLEPPAPPIEISSAMYGVDDICQRLKQGTEVELIPFSGPTTGPSSSARCTLNEVMALAPKQDNVSGAQTQEVRLGKNYWGLRGDHWGPQTGTMPDQGAQTYIPSTTDQAIAAGYHNGLGVVKGDADLLVKNLKAGIDIFGVLGNYNPQVATGDVQASEVLEGKTFSNAQGTDFTGKMPNQGAQIYTPSTQDQVIAAGYHNGQGVVKGDEDLTAGNILKGVELFEVKGQYEPPVSAGASGTAVASEVLAGKTFSNSQSVGLVGTMVDQGAKNYTSSVTDQPIMAGYYNGSGVVKGDVNLVASNIKKGVTIFGVAGDPNVVNTNSGDALPGELVSGKKAWVDGAEVTGSLSAQSLSPTSTTVTAGIYAATTLEAVDADLVSSNIKKDITIFGIAGDPKVVDTSSGDAVATEILTGKKAWVDGMEVTGTGQLATVPSSVPKTGQTVCYDAGGTPVSCTGTGQDGEYQKGVATSPRFTDNGDGTVTDNLTSLVWLKNANCIGTDNPGFDTDGTGGDGEVYWQTALNFVAGLNSGIYSCGVTQTDWRLPNLKELQSLIDYNQVNPALPLGHPFLDVQLGYDWSATTYVGNTSYAWSVYLSYGNVGTFGKMVNTRYVWPVRGG